MKASLLAVLALLVPTAAAIDHFDDDPYDALALDLTLHPAAGGKLAETGAAQTRVAFQGGAPNAPHPPLEFTYSLPGRFLVQGAAEVVLNVEIARPMVVHDKDGHSFEVSLALDGAPIEGATALLKLNQGTPPVGGVSAPGAAQMKVTLAPTPTPANASQALSLRVRPLMPVVPPDALHLVVGGDKEPTSLALPHLRVPTFEDLGLQDAPLEMQAATLPVPRSTATVAYLDLQAVHGFAELGPAEPVNGRRAFLFLRGMEGNGTAHQYHHFPDADRRAGAAHHFQVGNVLVRVHPGVAVKVPLAPGPDGLTTTVKCVLNCPQGGFERTIQLLAPDDPGGATGGTLIPPPRSTKGIPVSEDAPADEGKSFLPLSTLAPLAALGLAALARGRRG